MAKRQAISQLTRDGGDLEDEETGNEGRQVNPDEMARRPVKGLPKRGGSGVSSSPQKSSLNPEAPLFNIPTFGHNNGGSLFPPAGSIASSPASGAANAAAITIPTFIPPSSIPPSPSNFMKPSATDSDAEAFHFYMCMRSLNHSLITSLQDVLRTDAFADLKPALAEALESYTHHQKDISKAHLIKKPTTGPPNVPTSFSFGGKPLVPALKSDSESAPKSVPSSFTNVASSSEVSPLKPPIPPPSFGAFGARVPVPDISSSASAKSSPFSQSSTAASGVNSSSFSVFGRPSAFATSSSEKGAVPIDESSTSTARNESSETVVKLPPITSFGASGARDEPPVELQPKEETRSTTPPKNSVFGSSAFGSGATSPFKPSVFGNVSAPSTSPFRPSTTSTFGAFGGGSAFGSNNKISEGEELKSVIKAPSFGAFSGVTAAKPASTGFSFGSSGFGTSGNALAPAVGFGFGGALNSKDSKEIAAGDGKDSSGGPSGTASSPFAVASTKTAFSASSAFGATSFGSTGSSFGTSGTATQNSWGANVPSFGSGGSSFFKPGSGAGVKAGASDAPTDAPSSVAAGVAAEEGGDEESAAGSDFASVPVTDIEGAGEEGEEMVYVTRGKLLRLENGAWKSLGVGSFKIKRDRETNKMRVLFRTEGNGNVIANFNIFADMALVKKDKLLRFPGTDSSGLVPFGLQCKTPQMIEEAHDALAKASADMKVVVG